MRGVTFGRFYFGMLPTKCSNKTQMYPLTVALFPVLGQQPLLIIIRQTYQKQSLIRKSFLNLRYPIVYANHSSQVQRVEREPVRGLVVKLRVKRETSNVKSGP